MNPLCLAGCLAGRRFAIAAGNHADSKCRGHFILSAFCKGWSALVIEHINRGSLGYLSRKTTKCAETLEVPPASGVIVNAVELPAGLRTVRVEATTVVCTRAI